MIWKRISLTVLLYSSLFGLLNSQNWYIVCNQDNEIILQDVQIQESKLVTKKNKTLFFKYRNRIFLPWKWLGTNKLISWTIQIKKYSRKIYFQNNFSQTYFFVTYLCLGGEIIFETSLWSVWIFINHKLIRYSDLEISMKAKF